MKLLTVFPVQTRVHLSERIPLGPGDVNEVISFGESDCDCSSDCACAIESFSPPPKQLRLTFHDREAVLKTLLNHTFRITVLDAPAGYGKTYLLEEAKKQFEEKGWQCVLVSLPFDIQLLEAKSEIQQKIAQCLGFELPTDVLDLDAFLLGELKRIKNFVLMFDSVECDSEAEITHWIRQTIAESLSRTERKDYQIILAGRCIQQHGNPYKWDRYWRIPVFRPEVLQAIHLEDIKLILEDTRKTYNPSINEDLTHVAEGIAWLSAGHPGSIEKLVQNWMGSNFSRDYSPNTPLAELQNLFEKCVYSAYIQKLQRNLGDEQFKLLTVVSVFRQMDKNLLRELFIQGEIDGVYEEVWSKIIAMNLFVKDKHSGYWTDGVMRQIMARNLEIRQPDKYNHLHRIALGIWNRQLPKLAVSYDVFNHRNHVINALRNILYHAINCNLTEEGVVECLCSNLLAIQQYFGNDLEELVKLYEEANFDENDLRADTDWLEYLEIRHKPKPSLKEIKIYILHALSLQASKQPIFEPNPKGGNNPMEIKLESKLVDSLAKVLDFMRQTAQNVLIERWEKRTLGKAKTPPVFQYGNPEDIRQSLLALPPVSQSFTTPDGKTILLNTQLVENLLTIMENAQDSKGRLTGKSAKLLGQREAAELEQQMDEYQRKFDTAASDLADILVHLYSCP